MDDRLTPADPIPGLCPDPQRGDPGLAAGDGPGSWEDELTRMALSDSGPAEPSPETLGPTLWRAVALVVVAVAALAMVFWRGR